VAFVGRLMALVASPHEMARDEDRVAVATLGEARRRAHAQRPALLSAG
jgi:hypothetical protein